MRVLCDVLRVICVVYSVMLYVVCVGVCGLSCACGLCGLLRDAVRLVFVIFVPLIRK